MKEKNMNAEVISYTSCDVGVFLIFMIDEAKWVAAEEKFHKEKFLGN